MSKIERFEDIQAWALARDLVRRVYEESSAPGFSRDFALRDQIRRAAVSIMSNIAEGFERGGDREFAQFLCVAKGSCGEARAQLYVALDQGYISQETFRELTDLCVNVSKMLAGLIKYLKASPKRVKRPAQRPPST